MCQKENALESAKESSAQRMRKTFIDLQVFRDSLVIKWMTNDQNINDISHLTLVEHVKAISL